MEIEKLRKLWRLSQIPTHSPESLKELHQLVREASVSIIIHENKESPCNLCANLEDCLRNIDLGRMCLWTNPKQIVSNFEMGMEDA